MYVCVYVYRQKCIYAYINKCMHTWYARRGSCVLANEIKFRSVRMEMMQDKHEGKELEFLDVVATLSLHVVRMCACMYHHPCAWRVFVALVSEACLYVCDLLCM
jgi:hypothetical protein